MASSSAKTPLKRNIAGLFNHLRYTPPSGSKNDGGTSAGGRLRAEIDQQDDHDPATTQASAPTAGLDVPRLVKTERRSLFFPASAEVKQEDGEGDEGEIGSVDPSKCVSQHNDPSCTLIELIDLAYHFRSQERLLFFCNWSVSKAKGRDSSTQIGGRGGSSTAGHAKEGVCARPTVRSAREVRASQLCWGQPVSTLACHFMAIGGN